MNKIKNMLFAGALTLSAFGVVTYTSCNKDECKDVQCNNGGSCISGTCQCASGYEGANCNTESRAKFVKSWAASDQIGTSNLVYTVAIGNGTTINSVIISSAFSDNFFSNNISATVSNDASGNSIITIADQKPDANGNYRVAGTGTYSAGKINWTYTITRITPASTQNYTGVWQ